jgi:hypothetical protein
MCIRRPRFLAPRRALAHAHTPPPPATAARRVVWIGARTPLEQRPVAIAERNTFSTLGIFGGIVTGSVLSFAIEGSTAAGAAPGVLNILVSLGMIYWLVRSFSDRQPLPSKAPGGPNAGSDSTPWLHILLVGWAQFAGWTGFVAIEGSLSYVVVDAYGLSHREVFYAWVPVSGAPLQARYAIVAALCLAAPAHPRLSAAYIHSDDASRHCRLRDAA